MFNSYFADRFAFGAFLNYFTQWLDLNVREVARRTFHPVDHCLRDSVSLVVPLKIRYEDDRFVRWESLHILSDREAGESKDRERNHSHERPFSPPGILGDFFEFRLLVYPFPYFALHFDGVNPK